MYAMKAEQPAIMTASPSGEVMASAQPDIATASGPMSIFI